MVIVGVDPGTGIKSPTGLVVYEADSLNIRHAACVTSDFKKIEHRYKDICDKFELAMLELSQSLKRSDSVLVVFESFVMQGKAGETLQRLIGSLMGRVPYHFKVTHVSNMRVKLIIGGTGKADKLAVAEGVRKYFASNKASSSQVDKLIKQQQWDLLDALAIGVAGEYYEANKT